MVVLLSEDEDERLLKKGPDLFKELLRVYPVAEPEDYFKAGQWRDEMMKVDLQLIEAHRLEAGAPDPPALEEVKVPELPTAQPVAGVRPPLTGLSALMGARATVAGGAPAAAGGPLPGAGVAELRLLALFVAKWKLDATKTKLALAKLPAERRRYVIQNFKATATGEEAAAELEKYIEECEKTEAWGPLKPEPAAGTAPAANGAAVAPGPLVAQAGVKRPLAAVAPGIQDPSKRPTGPAGVLAARLQLQQPRPAARPPVAMGMQRPMVGPRPGLGRPPMMVQGPPQGARGARPPFTPGVQPRPNQGALMRGLLQKY